MEIFVLNDEFRFTAALILSASRHLFYVLLHCNKKIFCVLRMRCDIFLLLFSECDGLTCRLLYTSVIEVNKSY